MISVDFMTLQMYFLSVCDYYHKIDFRNSLSLEKSKINMKKIALATFILCVMTACTKSETQYTDQDNKRETVNNKASDTIRTLQEESDTVQANGKPTDIKTDNE